MKLKDDGSGVVWVRDTGQRHLEEEFALHEFGDCIYLAFLNGTVKRVDLNAADIATFNENGSAIGCNVFTQRHNGGSSATRRIYTSRAQSGATLLSYREENGTLVNSFTPAASTTVSVGGMNEDDSIHIAGIIGPTLQLEQWDSSGTRNWRKNIGGNAGGGLNFDANASYVATGGAQSQNLSGSFVAPAASTRVYDLGGTVQWTASHGATVQGLRFCPNGNLITGGDSNIGASGITADGMTTRVYDSSGSLLWSADHSNGLGSGSQVLAVCSDTSNNVYAAGGLVTSDGMTIRKYNSSGTLQWSFDWTLGAPNSNQQQAMSMDWFGGYLYIGGRRVVR